MPLHDRTEPGRVPKPELEPTPPVASGAARPPALPPKSSSEDRPTVIDTRQSEEKKPHCGRSGDDLLSPGVALGYALVVTAASVFVGGVAFVAIKWDAVKGWVQRVRDHGDADLPATFPHDNDSPLGANGAPTPPSQPPAEPPVQQIGFADLAKSAAERARKLADEISAKGKAVEPHLANAQELCQQLEGLADEVVHAVAAGKSPQPVVERFATAKAEFERAVTQADVITKEARQAAADAKAAAKEATDLEERARDTCKAVKATLDQCCNEEPPGSPKIPPLEAGYKAALKVLQDAEAARNDAKTSATKASEDTGALESSDRYLHDIRSRAVAAGDRIEESRAAVDAAIKAFDALKARLEAAGHLPLEGLDATVAEGQTKVLCEVGEARVALKLPSEPVTIGTGAIWTLVCVSGSAAATWDLIAKPAGPGDTVPLGNAWIDEQRTLRVMLPQRTDQNEKPRDALASAVLQLSNTGDPAANTYVQLCSPKRLPPLVFDRFFEGSGSGTSATYTPWREIKHELPVFGPLPATARLRGTCGPLEGETIAKPVVMPRSTASQFTSRPVAWAMLWKWKSEPLVQVDLALGSKPAGVGMHVVGATLQGTWAKRAWLGQLAEETQERAQMFRGLPRTPVEFQSRTIRRSELRPLMMDVYVRDIKRKKTGLDQARRMVDQVLSTLRDGNAMTRMEWTEAMRLKLVECPDYTKWVERTHPKPPGERPNAMMANQKEWDETLRQYAAAKSAAPMFLDPYWTDVKLRLAGDVPDEHVPALLCRCQRELREGVANVNQLLDAVRGQGAGRAESPAATFTGDVGVDFPSIGGRCVLLTFEASDPPGAR